MPAIVVPVFDHVSESQLRKADTANALFDALSGAALFGVQSLVGLALTLYGGNMVVAGVPTAVPTQTVTLTDNATNYVYSTLAGVFTVTTTLPTGWPGPITVPANVIALYALVVTSGAVAGTSFVPSIGQPGATGAQGPQGPSGGDVIDSRLSWMAWVGSNSTYVNGVGMNGVNAVNASATARPFSSASFRESIPYTAYLCSSTAGTAGQLTSALPFATRGDRAGRGGFVCSIRFCFESAFSPANNRVFVGMLASPVSTIGFVEPDTLLNVIGVGAKTAQANLSLLHNDGSGVATMDPLGSNFPARATDKFYELTLTAAPFAGTIDYELLDCETGNVAAGTINADLPDNTKFLHWGAWVSNGGSAGSALVGMAQVVGATRF